MLGSEPLAPQTNLETLFPVEDIEALVHRFYGRVQEDPELAPVFGKRIDAWPEHLERMVLFWRAILRGERTFKPLPRGGPPLLHRQIEELSRDHFRRWLALFGDTVDELFEGPAAARVKESARRIAASLSRHLPAEAGEAH